MRKIDITNYTLETNKIQEDFTFVMMSDLHSNVYGINLHHLNDVLNLVKPDAVFLVGDMINDRYNDDVTDVANFLSAMGKHYPVFYSLGNHEYSMMRKGYEDLDKYEAYKEFLENNQVEFLEDETIFLEKETSRIAVSGLMIDQVYYDKLHKKTMGPGLIDKHLGTFDPQVFHILMAHNPDFFPNYAAWGADLVLSGHVHGGIVRFPFIGGLVSTNFKLFPPYDAGLYHHGNSTMILGRGLGAHTIKIRINNRPELIVVKVLAKG